MICRLVGTATSGSIEQRPDVPLVGPGEDDRVRRIEQDDELVQNLDPFIERVGPRQLLGAGEQLCLERIVGAVGASGVLRVPAVDLREGMVQLVLAARDEMNAERVVGAQDIERRPAELRVGGSFPQATDKRASPASASAAPASAAMATCCRRAGRPPMLRARTAHGSRPRTAQESRTLCSRDCPPVLLSDGSWNPPHTPRPSSCSARTVLVTPGAR